MSDGDEPSREKRASDHPADLTRDRELLVRTYLRKGVELTENLLEENREIREELDRLRMENARMRTQLASDDAMRDLVKRIDSLEGERRALMEHSRGVEETSKENESRTVEIEAELHELANLYIASSHLHSSLSVRGVMRHLGELLQQLMGSERYAIYLLDRDGTAARAVLAHGIANVPAISMGEGAIGECLQTGLARIKAEAPLPEGVLEDPLALVPMIVREEVVGVIVVIGVLEQKDRWASVDHALFELIGSQAGNALVAACQFASRPDARGALDDIEEHLTQTA